MRGSSERERSGSNGLYREGQQKRRVAGTPKERERGKASTGEEPSVREKGSRHPGGEGSQAPTG